jgi:hypothetical protein
MSNLYIFLISATYDCVIQLKNLALIIIPISILIEFLKAYGIIDRISLKARSVMGVLLLPKEAALPCFAGIFLGILSGSGIILTTAQEGKLTHHHLKAIFIFVGICHSIIEENIIFIGSGASVIVIAVARFLAGFLTTYLWVHIFSNKVINEK